MGFLKSYILERFNRLIAPLEQSNAKSLVLQSLMVAKENRKRSNIREITDVEFSGFSQWGEDGIIDWLVERIPEIPKTFIEFGVENYKESNTRMLLCLRNWRGHVIDGSSSNILNIKSQDVSWRYDLTSDCAFIDRDNINNLIKTSGYTSDIGLLSVDIDGNDYWVWESITTVSPVIVVCEYNAVLGDLHPITIPYQADFHRTTAHYSNLYFGASLPALIKLGQKKGYKFVGTNSNGCNAFFVRNDYSNLILDCLDDVSSSPSLARESRNPSGELTFISGYERLGVIKHLPVFDIETNSIKSISDFEQHYSKEWQYDY